MIPSKDAITYYIFLAIVIWIGWWYLVYFLTGFHLKSFRINNGVSFNGISFESKRVKVTLGSFRWRLWGNTKLVIFDDLDIYVKEPSGKKGNPKKQRKKRKDVFKIYPENIIGKFIFRMLITRVPNVDLELRHSSITFSTRNAVRVDYLRFRLNSRYSVRYGDLIKFRPNLIISNVVYTVLNGQESVEPFVLSAARFETAASIQISTGITTRIKLKLHVDEIQMSVFNCLKVLIDQNIFDTKLSTSPSSPSPSSSASSSSSTSNETDSGSDLGRKLVDIHKRLYSVITDVSVNFESAQIIQIPFASVSDNKPLNVYFEAQAPKSVLKLDLKTISFNYQKLYKDDAGFEVLFDPKYDSPFHFSISGHLFKLGYVNKIENVNGVVLEQTDELFNIPNYSLTLKTNILDHLARGKGFKNCVMDFFSSTSTPVLDLSTDQLSEMVYNFILLKKYLKLRKVNSTLQAVSSDVNDDEVRNGESTEDSDDFDDTKVDVDAENKSESNRGSGLKDKIISLLNEFYPVLNVGLVMEQPRFIIRHYDKHSKKLQILNSSYSLLNFNLQTTDSRDYHSSCNILHPCMYYHEKSGMNSSNYRNELFKSEIVLAKSVVMHFHFFKNLKIQTDCDINDPSLDLSDSDVLTGIHQLLEDVTKKVETDLYIGISNTYISSRIMAIQNLINSVDEMSRSKEPLKSKIFNVLPQWLLSIQLNLNNVRIVLGSRSVLIPRNKLDSTLDEELSSGPTGDHHKLRQVRFTLESLKFKLSGPQDNADLLPSSSSSSTSTETLTAVNTLDYWIADISMNKLMISSCTNLKDEKHKFDPIVKIPDLSVSLHSKSADSESQLEVHSKIEQVFCSYDESKVFVFLGSLYAMRSFILEPVNRIKAKLGSQSARSRRKSKDRGEGSLSDFIRVKIDILKVNVVFNLSESFRVRLDAYDTFLIKDSNGLDVGSDILRLLVDSSDLDGSWNRMVCVDSPRSIFKKPFSKSKLVIDSKSIRIFQIHELVIHEFFDNLSIHLKAVKHLVKMLKTDAHPERVVNPSESKAPKIPNIVIMSQLMSFKMEDDPFESELNMIYQLGLIEQRKRQEIMTAFESRKSQEEEENEMILENLHKEISLSWIRKINSYKQQMRDESHRNQKFQFGNELNLPRNYNDGVTPHSSLPPLLSIYMENFVLDLATTKFDLKEVPKFIHDLGQGVPLESKYSLVLPTFMSLKLDELRVHMRDYPLPLLHVPKNNNGSPAFFISGHMVIAESLITAGEHVRDLPFAFFPEVRDPINDKYNSLLLRKSLSSVKFYHDLECQIHSQKPARFIWGQSYQFGIQQVMLNFDQFSKPPVDPSEKLGFWDKLRLISHGKLKISTVNRLDIGLKGSRDPYDLFDTASGFILSFKENVEWRVNENDDSKSFFNIASDKVTFMVPNYLSSPLVSWSAPSSSFIYLPKDKNMITSCFGYYLLDKQSSQTVGPVNFDVCEKNVINLSGGILFKVGFLLQREDENGRRLDNSIPHHQVELWNPKYTKSGHDSYEGFRNQYIHMAMSLYADSETSYNSIHLSPRVFEQFFKWWKLFSGNMQLPIRRGKMFGELKQSKKFSQHLFTNKFQFHFKSLFMSHIYRDENLETDNDTVECVGIRAKMDDFMVDLHQRKEPRIETHEGLDRNKKLLKMNFSIGEVHLSGIDIRAISAQFIQNIYTNGSNSKRDPESRYHIFDEDKRWFDINDFEEIFLPSLKNSNRKISVYPLLYSERFSYLRDTEVHASPEASKFGKENTHDCLLYTKNIFEPQINILYKRLKQLKSQMNKGGNDLNNQLKRRMKFIENEIVLCQQKWNKTKRKGSLVSNERSGEKFHNKFMLISMFLKWNLKSRNAILRYIHFVKAKKDALKCLSYESVNILNDIVGTSGDSFDDSSSKSNISSRRLESNKFEENISGTNYTSEDAINNFNEILRVVLDGQEITEDYLIEIISPQIQLQSDEKADSVVLVSAPSIDIKIVSVIDSSTNGLEVNSQELENRYGIMLKDANIFVLNKSDTINTDQSVVIENGYGSKSNWPPWLGIEICKNGQFAGQDKLLIEKMSMSVVYNDIKLLGSKLSHLNDRESSRDIDPIFEISNSGNNKLLVDVPKFVITSTSKQYFTLYVIVLSLLFYTEPMSKSFQEKLEKLKFSIDFENLDSIHERLSSLHKYHQMIKLLSRSYDFRSDFLGNEDLNDFLLLSHERAEVESEICLLITSIINGDIYQNDQSKSKVQWFIRADQVILHMLEDDRTPILDIALAKGTYTRNINEDGSNNNRIEIGMMQGFNLIPNASYQSFIEPLNAPDTSDAEKRLLEIEWTMSRTVGGIKVMEKFEVDSQPLNIKIDELTGLKLMKYIFLSKNDNNEDNSSSDTQYRDKEALFEVEDSKNEKRTRAKIDSREQRASTKSSMVKSSKSSSKNSSSDDSSSDDYEDNIDEMISRSKNFMSIVTFKFNPVAIMISIRMSRGYKKLLNVQDLLIHLPELSIENEFLSFLDLSMVMKKSIIKVLMKHSGTVLRNKFKVKSKSSKHLINTPLKPLKRYVQFTQLSELKSESDTIDHVN